MSTGLVAIHLFAFAHFLSPLQLEPESGQNGPRQGPELDLLSRAGVPKPAAENLEHLEEGQEREADVHAHETSETGEQFGGLRRDKSVNQVAGSAIYSLSKLLAGRLPAWSSFGSKQPLSPGF